VSEYHGATADRKSGRRMLAVVAARQGRKGEGLCNWPGCSALWEEVDHVVPRSIAPELTDDPENWQGLCRYHNRAKGDGSPWNVPAGAGPAPSEPGPSREWLS
jgi:5-methylcytosine-specific restriction endonuclease McrA